MAIKIAICQLKVKNRKKENLAKAANMVRKSAKNASIIVLPEMFNCPYDIDFFPAFAEKYPGETTNMLSSLAKELKILLIGGSIPETEDGHIYNTCFIFNQHGKLIARHRKIHLYDVDIKGKISFKESSVLSSGNKITVFDTKFCKIGVCICYDMRFPGLASKIASMGAKMIIVPAAFNMTTGPAHWHVINRARALDNQIYFVSASPARNQNSSYKAYGHSMIVNPWGKIIKEASHSEQILYGSIDLDYLGKIRSELPVLKHKRENIN